MTTRIGQADGAPVLDDVARFVERYVAFPSPHCVTVVVLWAAHTWAAERFYVTPRLVLDSAEPGSGKTRVLEVLVLLCRMPKLTISTTTAALYRRIAAAEVPITVLMDEVDALFGPRPTPQAEDLRALLNAGYKRGATVDRCVGDGKSIRVEEFPVFAPCALAGLAGRMPSTITTRSVVVHMRRRAPGEHVQPFRERDAAALAEPARAALAGWVDLVATDLEQARPEMPARVVDRPAEVWEALLAVADAAGGDWPDRARSACRYFVLDTDDDAVSFGVRLLRDVRLVFDGADRMPSADLVAALVKLDEAPYADLYGKPIDQRRVATELGRYGVKAKPVRMTDGRTPRGYLTAGPDGLLDAWQRYLPDAATGATDATGQVNPVADVDPVALASATDTASATADSAVTCDVAPVASVAPSGRRPAPVFDAERRIYVLPTADQPEATG